MDSTLAMDSHGMLEVFLKLKSAVYDVKKLFGEILCFVFFISYYSSIGVNPPIICQPLF